MAGQAPDPTGGATHFLNPALVTSRGDAIPGWASGNRTTIGQHDFYYAPYSRGGGGATAATTATPAGTPTPYQTASTAPVPPPTRGSGGVVAGADGSGAPAAPAATTAAAPGATPAAVPASPVATPGATTPATPPARSPLPDIPAPPAAPTIVADNLTAANIAELQRMAQSRTVSADEMRKAKQTMQTQNAAAARSAYDDQMGYARELRERASSAELSEQRRVDLLFKADEAQRKV